jgi:glutaredoxin
MKHSADIYRIVTPDHLCPWGIKAKDLLKRHGYEVNDHHLETEEADRNYKAANNVDETPQIFIDGEHIGGFDALREHLGLGPDPKQGETYQPVIAIFAVTLSMAITTQWAASGAFSIIRIAELFIAFSMCALGIQKIRDLQSYTNGFVLKQAVL